MKWKSMTMPKVVSPDAGTLAPNFGRFIVEPLERGFGTTLGNALRRILLSSIQGAAVTCIRIDGILHEFSAIPGVMEDVTQIILNVKKIRPRLHTDEAQIVVLEAKKEGNYTAGDLQFSSGQVEIMNPEQHIIELSKDASVRMELEIGSGRGYVLAEQNTNPERPAGSILVDSLFSPVLRVNYLVENTRIGQRTDYDRLILEITTDGTISPDDSLSYAAKILKDHTQLFITVEEEFEAEKVEEVDDETLRIRQLLDMRVDELELSVRSSNCLRAANIQVLRDLVGRTESEMLKYRNFGRKSLTELNAILSELGLSFGMDISKYEEPVPEEV
jgi:DNA-directed RNA polymerase subunit alpha